MRYTGSVVAARRVARRRITLQKQRDKRRDTRKSRDPGKSTMVHL